MLSTLIARYDAQLLRPPATPEPPARPAALPPQEQELQQQLLAWCRDGAGDGRSSRQQQLSIALLTGAPATGRCALVEDTSLQLDGTYALLAAGGRWRQRLFRLRVKAGECLWWRPRPPDSPWDSGYLVDSAEALARLPRFQPRRPTLIVAQHLADAPLRDALHVLAARRASLAQPVRLLVLAPSAPPALAAWPMVEAAPCSRGPWSLEVLRPTAG